MALMVVGDWHLPSALLDIVTALTRVWQEAWVPTKISSFLLLWQQDCSGDRYGFQARFYIFQPHRRVRCRHGAQVYPVQCEQKWDWPHLHVLFLPAFPWAGMTNTRATLKGRCYRCQIQGWPESLNDHTEESCPLTWNTHSVLLVRKKETSFLLMRF